MTSDFLVVNLRHMKSIVPHERIESRIYIIRGVKVMLDRDLAGLYGVKTMVLNQAVRRNIERFPDDFMFQLTKEEFINWKSQIVISKSDRKGLRKTPLVFTEQGVAMLSSVLKSKQAVAINVQIMRTFMRIRDMVRSDEQLLRRLDYMERHYDQQFKIVFDALRSMYTSKDEPSEIGFKAKKR